MAENLEVRLVGGPHPSGEIRARDLAAIADSLQELRLRIGREIINAGGPGRTKDYMAELAEIRLRAIGAGSTVLDFAQGSSDKLDGLLAQERDLEERFHEIVAAIARDQRPFWTTELIAESAARLVDGFRAAAPQVIVRNGSRALVTIETGSIHRETWVSGRVLTDDIVTARGRLERVDLRTHEFRVRDDVGNAVDLRHVVEDQVAGPMVGRWVVAEGRAMLDSAGRVVALEGAVVQPAEDPAVGYVATTITSLEVLLARAPGPDPAGALDLDDEDFAAFLGAARS